MVSPVLYGHEVIRSPCCGVQGTGMCPSDGMQQACNVCLTMHPGRWALSGMHLVFACTRNPVCEDLKSHSITYHLSRVATCCHVAGTPEQALAEAVRLSVLLADLTSSVSGSAAYQQSPASTDAQGQLLHQLQILTEQRVAAIAAELQHLKSAYGISDADLYTAIRAWQQAQVQTNAAATHSADKLGTDMMLDNGQTDEGLDPWRSMISWMTRHGATVSLVSWQTVLMLPAALA